MIKDIASTALSVIFVGLVFIFFLAPIMDLMQSGFSVENLLSIRPDSILGHAPVAPVLPEVAGNFNPDAGLDISQVVAG